MRESNAKASGGLNECITADSRPVEKERKIKIIKKLRVVVAIFTGRT
jgi:hypothetical protein